MGTSFDSQVVDQRENDRREREAARIAILPNDEQQAAIEAEVIRQGAYKSRLRHANIPLDWAIDPGTPLPPLNSSLQHTPNITGMFRCHHPGCTAAPFQTQYLLKYIRSSKSMILTNEHSSHTNVHGSNRPHYCPVADCPRGEGGKGFKRKNEMIRHGLVHQSPGYICPFCPDREHKYPRPDNLERYVKIKPTLSLQKPLTDFLLLVMYVCIIQTKTKTTLNFETYWHNILRLEAVDAEG
jgi:hypothetical protein